MGWKQTLILGGAVLLLAACDRATAPIANVRGGGIGGRANSSIPAEPPTTSIDSTGQTSLPEDCPPGAISLLSGDPDGGFICVEIDY